MNARQWAKTLLREEVTEADFAEIISKWTGIPLALVASNEEVAKCLSELHRRVDWSRWQWMPWPLLILRSRAGLPISPMAGLIFFRA